MVVVFLLQRKKTPLRTYTLKTIRIYTPEKKCLKIYTLYVDTKTHIDTK